MPAARRSRTAWIVAASVIAHAGVIAVLWLHAPRLFTPPSGPATPEAIIPVLIMPRALPPDAASGDKPTVIRLHRRKTRFADDLPIAPLIATVEEEPKAAGSDGTRTPTLDLPSQAAVAANARRALRSRLDCNDPALTRAERAACEDRFAADGRDAPFAGLGLDRDKAEVLDQAAARREADARYRRGAAPAAPSAGGLPWDVQRSSPSGTDDLGKALGQPPPAGQAPL
jgi:hypothetical protein